MLVRRSSDPSQLSSPRMHMLDSSSPKRSSPETPISSKKLTRSLSSSSTSEEAGFEGSCSAIKPGHFRSESRFQGRFEVMDLDQIQMNLQQELPIEEIIASNGSGNVRKNTIVGRFHVLELGSSPPKSNINIEDDRESELRKRMHSADDISKDSRKNSVPVGVGAPSVIGRFEVVDIQPTGLTPPIQEPPIFSKMTSSQSSPNLAASSRIAAEENISSANDLERISTIDLMAELNRRLVKVLQENECLKKQIAQLSK